LTGAPSNSYWVDARRGAAALADSLLIVADQDDLAISTVKLAAQLRVSSLVSLYKITGFTAPAVGGFRLTVINSGAAGGGTLRLMHEDTGSEEGNRLDFTPLCLPWVVLVPGAGITFEYDATTQRWRYLSGADSWLTRPPWTYGCEDSFQGGTGAGAGTCGDLGWGQSGAGTTSVPSAETDAWGARRITTAAVGAERCLTLGSSTAASASGIPGTGSLLVADYRVRMPETPTAGDDFYVLLGISDMAGGIGGTNKLNGTGTGAVFEVDRAQSTSQWMISTGSDAGLYTQTASGVNFSTSYTRLRVVWDTVDSKVFYYINGALVGTITTTLPGNTIGRNTGCFYTSRGAGTATRGPVIDHFWFREHRR
jgi:hypothetical protein